MKNLTLVLGICVAVTATLAAPPLSQKLSPNNRFSANRFHNIIRYAKTGRGESHIKSIISLRYLMTIATRDSFSDLIERELGMSATAFLQSINTLFHQVDEATNIGQDELNRAYQIASISVKLKINAIKANAIQRIFDVTEKFLLDLGRVLIGMPNGVASYDPIVDKIRALLCKTLQQFVETIRNALEQTYDNLSGTINELLDLAEESDTGNDVATILNNVVSKLNGGRIDIRPMIANLNNLLNFRMGVLTSMNKNKTEKRDLLDETVFEVFGFSAYSAAIAAEDALSELVPLIESTREELVEALSLSDDSEVQTKVMEVYDSSMDSFIGDAKPLYTTFADLQGSACNGTYIYDLMGTLPGVGMDYFKPYLKHESSRIATKLQKSFIEIETEASLAGPEIAMKVSKILHNEGQALLSIADPLMKILNPILDEPKKDASKQTQMMLRREDEVNEETWLEPDGHLYNRDALITAVTKKIGFDVEAAAKALKTSLENIDSVFGITLSELDIILAGNNVDIHEEILKIMNETLIDVHVASQPMLNVLLPFIPDGFRSNKHIALDIYSGISGVDIKDFLVYCSAAVKAIIKMNDDSMHQIKDVAANASPQTNEEINALLDISQQLIITYIMPFIDVIKPIISPDV